jgi:hypothetical protein
VLPDVDPEQRLVRLHDRRVLVRQGVDGEVRAVVDEPGPAGAETVDAGVVDLLLQLV